MADVHLPSVPALSKLTYSGLFVQCSVAGTGSAHLLSAAESKAGFIYCVTAIELGVFPTP
jgi:hypothetical protein